MRWIVILIYTTLIYSTLSIARDIVNTIRSVGSIEVITFISVGLFLLVLLFTNIKSISKKQILYRILLTLGFITLIITVAEFPEEKMHVIEYGILGWLIAWAISKKSLQLHYAILGILLGWAIGFGDEIIQYFLPNRVYDLRDVLINGISVTIGFLFFLTSKR